MPDLSGQTIGRYHILEKLGEGGMAVVYKAHDTRLEREVAFKIIRRGVFSPLVLECVLKRFEREAKALAKLSHPNIVHVHDYGKYRGAPYLVMEYLPGGVLKTGAGASKPMGWQEAARLLLPVAEALEAQLNVEAGNETSLYGMVEAQGAENLYTQRTGRVFA